MATSTVTLGIEEALKALEINDVNHGTSTGSHWMPGGEALSSHSPVDGELIGKVTTTTPQEYEQLMQTATKAFKQWRLMPAPQRGEVVRQFGDELRRLKEPLGKLVSYEMGKSLQEGLGATVWPSVEMV